MSQQPNDKSIATFWTWFSDHCQHFGKQFDNKSLLNELDARIFQLGNFTWEPGPGESEENALVISPGGNPKLLEFTKAIIAKALPCKGWEYHYAKPPKQWEYKFYFQATDGNSISVDASSWKYVLFQFEDGSFDIVLEAPKLKDFNDTDKLIAAEILLDGILGEEKRMTMIVEIEIVDELPEGDNKRKSRIDVLARHIATLI